MVLTFNLSLISEMGEHTSSLCLMNSTNHIILFIIHVFPSICSVLGKKFYSVLSVCVLKLATITRFLGENLGSNTGTISVLYPVREVCA